MANNSFNINIDKMYSLHLVEKKEKEAKLKIRQESKQKAWLKKYHSEVKPKLLQRYDARVNAFIRQIQEAPQDKSKIQKHYKSNHFRPFKFSSASTQSFNSNQQTKNPSAMNLSSIIRSSDYVPLSTYQFRDREKEKEIKPKIQLKILKYRKWQKESHLIASINKKEDGQMSRMSARQFFRRVGEDNRSQIPSLYDDNQSLRFSVANDNIEGEAREYEKNQELREKKQHFKRLANLEQIVQDSKAKRSIHELLVKGGITKPKIHSQTQEYEVDLLKAEMQKNRL